MPTVKDIIVKKPTEDEIADAKTWPIWTCDVSTFDWDYTESETCLILEGKVSVQERPGEEEVSFGPGDMVVFPNGLACIWKVTEAVKKHYKFE
jgi:uncharacterized protein